MASFNNIIQVAGIHDLAEANTLIQAGVNFLGFPLCLTVHTPDVTENMAANIIRALPTTANTTLITYLNNAYNIKRLAALLQVKFVQLHGDIPMIEVAKIKKFSPHIKIMKAIIIKDTNLDYYATYIKHYTPYVDAFITDSYDRKTGACGATGKTHDWQVSRTIVQISPRPVILAGGLTPDNVKAAILAVRPAGVDVHTGIEDENGRKDFALTKSFVDRAKAAFAELNYAKVLYR